MKKSFFSGRTKSKPRRRSCSDENLMTRFYSTDPKDLPDGFNVGSMSVAYVPPSPSPDTDWKEQHQRKRKKSKEHKAKDRRKSPVPVISRPIASLAASRFDTTDGRNFSQQAVRISSSPLRIRRSEWAAKERMQRSCSVDALDEIGTEEEEDEEEEVTSPSTPEIKIRRCSTEIEGVLKPGYRRGVSYNTEVVRPKKSLYQRPNRSFHGQSQLKKLSPILKSQSSIPSAQRALHGPKSVEHLLEALQCPGVNVNLVDEKTGNAPIHTIIKKKKKDRLDLLLTLLVHSDVEIDLQNSRDMTALHMAIEAGCEMCTRAAIVFGADINKQGCNQFTALDLVINSGKLPAIETILMELGAKGSTEKLAECHEKKKIPRLYSFAQKMKPPKRAERLKVDDKLSEYINSKGMNKLYNELEINVVRRLSISATIGGADDAFSLVLQQRELALYNRTQPKPRKKAGTAFGLRGGSRILFLDGGGIKGLVQLEVLIQLEERTQCKIPDLFDWIVGTSTGAVIALAMVYGKKSLRDLRQLYFLLKNRIFMKSRHGYGYSSDVLEEILKEYLNPELKMSDETHPKVLIAAVNKATTNLELHFFNNCFEDEFSDFPVWKVARYTSAAPMFFNEYENYVDGGVICNNPTDYGLTAIQDYCRLTGNNVPIAAVVSIGTGVYPAVKIGSVDAQEALFFGKQWLHPGKLIKQTQNLMSLLSTALVESEMVASNSRSRCKEQDIPFFRFSPKFDELIAAGETDTEKLLNMIIKTKLDLKQREKEFDELVNLFLAVAESSKDLDQDAVLEADQSKLQANRIIDEEDEEEEEEQEREETVDGRIDKIEGLKKLMEKERREPSTEEGPSTLEVEESGVPIGESSSEKTSLPPEVNKNVEEEALTMKEQARPSVPPQELVEGDPITQQCKLVDNDNAVCTLDETGEFAGNFLFNSISNALGGKKLELPIEEAVSPSLATPSSAEVVTMPTANGQTAPHTSDQFLEEQSSAAELYMPYRTDTNQVDESNDEYTPYKRETLV